MNGLSIILADEPTGNLDIKTGKEVFDLLKMLSSKFRRTIVMVTHNPELAEATDRATSSSGTGWLKRRLCSIE